MAVPGNVLSGRNRGGHALIRDGAKIVECADDIVEELGWRRRRAGAASCGRKCDAVNSVPAIRSCGCMDAGRAYDLDALAERVGPAMRRGLLPRLLDLELQGWCGASGAAVSCGST